MSRFVSFVRAAVVAMAPLVTMGSMAVMLFGIGTNQECAFALELKLPPETDRAPESYDWLGDRLTAYVWRNWNLVSLDRLAEVIDATPAQVEQIAKRLGLPEYQPPSWTDAQIYITLIRRNWHLLPFDQMMTLVAMTEQRFAFCLIEDDFLWIKLGSVKPQLRRLVYSEPSAEAWQRIDAIGEIVRQERLLLEPAGTAPAKLFDFIAELKTLRREDSASFAQQAPVKALSSANRFGLRYIYSYFALFGDPLADENAELYPDGLLEKLADAGVNGVWLHVVLRDMAPGNDDFPEFGAGHEQRQANLRKLVARAKKFGIDIYLYMNEPRAMQPEFFASRPDFRGVTAGPMQAICTSRPEIKKWMADALANLFANVPGLGGIFTITASENLTTCASYGVGLQQNCPRCRDRSNAEIIAEINTVMAEGVHRAAPDAKVIAWDWGWNGHGLAPEIIAQLPADVWFMSVSEWGLPLRRGGVETSVGEYSISAVGPGPRSVQEWGWAKEGGRKTVAKVQLNVTWEAASVPFVPAMELVARHAHGLAEIGVDGLMMSWSLGGHPSPNLEIPERFNRDPLPTIDAVLDELAVERYGVEGRSAARAGWKTISRAFEEFPYDGSVVYNAPIQIGPANPLRLRPTGYRSTMVGIPYDDLAGWCGPYPPEIFASQLEKVADGFAAGIAELRRAEPFAPASRRRDVAAEIRYADTVRIIYRSVANQTRFLLARNTLATDEIAASPESTSPKTEEHAERCAALRRDMARLATEEIELARELYRLCREDSRIGFESSNQYFFTPGDLLEKILNARFAAPHLF